MIKSHLILSLLVFSSAALAQNQQSGFHVVDMKRVAEKDFDPSDLKEISPYFVSPAKNTKLNSPVEFVIGIKKHGQLFPNFRPSQGWYELVITNRANHQLISKQKFKLPNEFNARKNLEKGQYTAQVSYQKSQGPRPEINYTDSFDFSIGEEMTTQKGESLNPKLVDLSQAALIPQKDNNGKVYGFKVMDLKPDSVYLKGGLMNGDVITHLNGQPCDNALKAMELLKVEPRSKTLEVFRGEQKLTIRVEIPAQ